MKVSASQIKKWSECALQAKFIYVDGLKDKSGSAAMFGSAVHESFDAMEKGADLAEGLKVFNTYLDENPPDYWNRNTKMETYRANGAQYVGDYYHSMATRDFTVLASELKFHVKFGKHTVSGAVDRLAVRNDGSALLIIDSKTGRKPNKDGLRIHTQFSLYDWASRQREFWVGNPDEPEKYPGIPEGEELFEFFKEIPREPLWHDVKTNSYINTGARNSLDYARIHRVIDEIERSIEHECFIPTVDESTCVWCDFTDRCAVYFDDPLIQDSTPVTISSSNLKGSSE